MSEPDPFAKGIQGEHRVAKILEDLRSTFGYGLIHDILLDFNGTTSQIDHLLIDRFGILVIETKTYGALLKGRSEDRYWTACYAGARHRRMYNPLLQNEGHRKWLGKLLFQHGRNLADKYAQSLIVFAEGETRTLDLSGIDPMRVISQDGLLDFIRARYDFEPNEGQLGYEAQLDLYQFILAMNQRGNSEVEARHLVSVKAAEVGRPKKRQVAYARPRRTGISPPHTGQHKTSDSEELAKLALIALTGILLWLVLFGARSCLIAPITASVARQQPIPTQASSLP